MIEKNTIYSLNHLLTQSPISLDFVSFINELNSDGNQKRIVEKMMDVRWRYKTVNFELKKDGLLGNAFIDELEIEEVLNELGEEGWELVSMLETRDAVIAVFKRIWKESSLEGIQRQHETDSLKGITEDIDEPEAEKSVVEEVDSIAEPEPVIHEVIRKSPSPVSDTTGNEQSEPEKTDPDEEEDEQNGMGIGSIRIE